MMKLPPGCNGHAIVNNGAIRESEREKRGENLGTGSSGTETFLTWRRRRSLCVVYGARRNLIGW